MGHALSIDGAENSRTTPAPPSLKQCRTGRPVGGRAARRGPAPTRLPTLDWPVDLFSDNVSLEELVTVDFLLQCDPSCGPLGRQDPEFYTQIAA